MKMTKKLKSWIKSFPLTKGKYFKYQSSVNTNGKPIKSPESNRGKDDCK